MTQTSRLSNREQEVVELLLQGKSNKMIAAALGISERTVEFHLKNIYAKHLVGSRVELILKLGIATGESENEKLGESTVVRPAKNVENSDRHLPLERWIALFKEFVAISLKEPDMKNLFDKKHVLVGILAALGTGLVWTALFMRAAHMQMEEIAPWLALLVLIWAGIGWVVGLVGKRNNNSPTRIFFSTLVGTGSGAFAMFPLIGLVVYPLAKLAQRVGMIDPSAISADVASTLAIVAMLALWLIVGIVIGAGLLFLSVRRTAREVSQTPAS